MKCTNCTDLAKGLAIGSLLGGTLVCLLKCRRRKKYGVLGTVLKIAGSVLESVSRVLGI